MSAAAEVGLTLARELRRNLRSAKGLVSTLLFLLGGAGSLLIYVQVSREVNALGGGNVPQAAQDEARRQLLAAVYSDPATVQHLVAAPPTLLFLYNATLVLLPMLSMLIGYDTLAGELQHRTLRFATVRAHRESLVVGKFLGVWLAGAAISLVLHGLAWALTIGRGDAPAGTTVFYGLQFWVAAVCFTAGYVGLTTVVSSMFRTPMLALLTTIAGSFVWWLLRYLVRLDALDSVRWLAKITPGEWEPRLLSPDVLQFGLAAAVVVGLGAVGLLGACAIVRRRDV